MLNLNFKKPKDSVETTEFQRHYTGNWIWRAVAALIGEEECSHSPSWYAERLGAPVEDIVQALHGLEKLGILRRTDRGYKRVLKYVYFSDRNLNTQKLISDHVLISSQILSRLNANPNEINFYRTSFIGTSEKKAKEFCERLETLIKEFLIDSSQATPESVFAFSLSLIDVATPKKEATHGSSK